MAEEKRMKFEDTRAREMAEAKRKAELKAAELKRVQVIYTLLDVDNNRKRMRGWRKRRKRIIWRDKGF